MTDASTPADRRVQITRAIAAHRRGDSESPVSFGLAGDDQPTVAYEDREIILGVDDDERDRLDTLLDEFPVFKIAQPDTRKAPDGVVHVSALADPKHAADFLDRLFLDVFEAGEGYELRIQD